MNTIVSSVPFWIIAVLLLCILGLLVYREITDDNEQNKKKVSYLNIDEVMNKIVPETQQPSPINVDNTIPEESNANNIDYSELTFEETTDNTTSNESKPQVFNLSENVYTYDDAKIACKAVGAEMASLDQLSHAHKSGANWCNYGWSKQQMALYPIQKDYWDKIQSNPLLAKSCGFPGINGVFFKNTDLLFGANCYGMKPEPKGGENVPDYETAKSSGMNEAKYFSYKNKVPKVAPFSNKKWSSFE
jgi:hypothetical protein